MRIQALMLSYASVILGAASFLYAGLSGRNEGPFVQAAGAIVVAGLALFGVATGVTSWQNERTKSRKQRQEEAYASLVLQLLARFTSVEVDPEGEAQIRSKVAVWAEAPVIQALSEWNRVYDQYVPSGSTGDVTLDDSGRKAFEEATAKVAEAVRKELNPGDKVQLDQLIRALFNRTS